MKIPEPIQQAIQAYYAERANDEDIAALETWLREDEANVRIFAEHGLVEWQLLCETEKADAAAILTMLREAEESAEPVIIDQPQPLQPHSDDPGSLSAHDMLAAGSYLLRHSFTPKVVAILATAAALLLGVTLLIVLSGGEPDTTPIAEDTPREPGRVGPAQVNPVATLTAQHDAHWASGSPSTGDALAAGQRLILTAGFAKITTAQGAEVLLQAPCSIEMTGGDNALRLVRGELSARVDTVRAQGFTVYLPQNSRIVDLGTAFRVAVDASGQADCLVTEGKVLWQPDDQDDASALIVAGQSAQLVNGRPVVADVEHVFVEDFDGYTAAEENFYDEGQLDTGLRVAHLGSLPGWKHTGFHSIHAVDHANPVGNYTNTPDYAAMVIYGRMETAVSGANEAGQYYEVSYLAGPAVYKERDRRTTADDRLLIELLRRDGTVLASHTHRPGAWAGRMTLYPDRFTYRGDGSGALTLRIGMADAGLHDITSETGAKKYDNPQFAGAIDDLAIRVIDASSNSTTDRGNEQP